MNHSENHTKHLEEWLDAALRRCGQAEPHPALESRILSNLRAQRERAAVRLVWGTALAMAAAVLLVAVAFGWMHWKDRGPVVVKMVPAETGSLSTSETNRGREEPKEFASACPLISGGISAAARTGGHEAMSGTISGAGGGEVEESRLGQFPSSRPETEQARLLAAYLENAPAGEVLAVAAATNSMQDLAISDLSVAPLSGEAENSKEEK
jgi:hypothetical protein